MTATTDDALRRYDAFISYSHDAQSDVVIRLHAELERFGKPWWRARSLEIYRDSTAMAATTALWGTIVEALTMSGKLIVVASPEAARSDWVDREIATWLAEHPATTIILVLVEGELKWADDGSGWDLAASTALPKALHTAFTDEPLWVDMRGVDGDNEQFTDRVATVAAAITGIPKDKMIGLHVRQQRRTRRHVGVAGAGGVVLLVGVLIATFLLNQQTTATTAGRLAAASESHLGTDLGLAQLLAVQAYRTQATAQTRTALFRAVSAAPEITAYLPAGGAVTSLAAATGSPVIVAGTQSGDVVRWVDGRREPIARLAGPVDSIGISADGSVIGMVGGSTAMLWDTGRLRAVDIPDGRRPKLAAVTPSGRLALFQATSTFDTSSNDPPGTLVTVDVQASTSRFTDASGFWSAMVAAGANELVLASPDGKWERRSVDAVMLRGSAYVGVHEQVFTLSPDGRYFSFSNGAENIPVWDVVAGDLLPVPVAETGPFDTTTNQRSVRVPGRSRNDLAISPAGARMAVADTGSVYVTPISPTPGPSTSAIRLGGNERVSLLRFVGEDHLVAAAGDEVVMWDLTRTSRLGASYEGAQFDVPPSCSACTGLRIATRPDSQAVAVTGPARSISPNVLVLDLNGPAPSPFDIKHDGPAYQSGSGLAGYGDALWTSDSRLVLQSSDTDANTETEVRTADGTRVTSRWPRNPTPSAGLARAPDGQVYDVDPVGNVAVRDGVSGAVRVRIASKQTIRATERPGLVNGLLVNPDGPQAAFTTGGALWVEDLTTGQARQVVDGGVSEMAFAGNLLLVRHDDGTLDVRDASGALLAGHNNDQGGTLNNQWGATSTLTARVRSDSRVSLTDNESGTEIANFPIPPQQDSIRAGVTFTPDGATMVIAAPGDPYGDVQRWSISPEDWINIACRTAGRDLDPGEYSAAAGTGTPGDLRCRR